MTYGNYHSPPTWACVPFNCDRMWTARGRFGPLLNSSTPITPRRAWARRGISKTDGIGTCCHHTWSNRFCERRMEPSLCVFGGTIRECLEICHPLGDFLLHKCRPNPSLTPPRVPYPPSSVFRHPFDQPSRPFQFHIGRSRFLSLFAPHLAADNICAVPQTNCWWPCTTKASPAAPASARGIHVPRVLFREFRGRPRNHNPAHASFIEQILVQSQRMVSPKRPRLSWGISDIPTRRA